MGMDESGNPKSHGCEMMPNYEAVMLRYELRTLKVQFLVFFFVFGFVLQITMFNVVIQWSFYGELVSVVEQNPCCLIDNLYG
jgi:hypothetical protein